MIAHNSDQPNTRWYSGAGIYRPVWLVCLPKQHILPDSIVIKTEDWQKRIIRVSFRTTGAGAVGVEILDGEKPVAARETDAGSVLFSLDRAELWSPEHPRLYTCRLTYGKDVQEVRFGIRTVEADA